jgi:hypothetical protein
MDGELKLKALKCKPNSEYYFKGYRRVCNLSRFLIEPSLKFYYGTKKNGKKSHENSCVFVTKIEILLY